MITRIVVRNTRRHLLRTVLTVLGITVALLAYCLINTLINAWYSGVKMSAKNRLVTRNSVSLVFPLPLAYFERISRVPGIQKVGHANWFGGIYKDESFRFAQFAINDTYLDLYPELQLSPEERSAFTNDRKGAIIGKDMAEKYGIRRGDVIQIKGTIYPGLWEFTIDGVYTGRDSNVMTRTLFFHYKYLNERIRSEAAQQVDQVGIFVSELDSSANPAVVSSQIDALFANSYAETLTETETAFQQSFVSMSSSIILALRSVSYVVIVIMLLVLANTMLMASRERYREYAIMKSLGFTKGYFVRLIFGEALVITALGFLCTAVLLVPLVIIPPAKFLGALINFFPIFRLEYGTVAQALLLTIVVACLAALIPYLDVLRTPVAKGLRRIG